METKALGALAVVGNQKTGLIWSSTGEDMVKEKAQRGINVVFAPGHLGELTLVMHMRKGIISGITVGLCLGVWCSVLCAWNGVSQGKSGRYTNNVIFKEDLNVYIVISKRSHGIRP